LLVALIVQTTFSSVTFLHDNATMAHWVRKFDKSGSQKWTSPEMRFFLLRLKAGTEVPRLRQTSVLREAWLSVMASVKMAVFQTAAEQNGCYASKLSATGWCTQKNCLLEVANNTPAWQGRRSTAFRV
jgi:hypothetical protein